MQSGYHVRKRFACAFSIQGNGSLQFGPSEPRDSSQEEECYCLVLLTNREIAVSSPCKTFSGGGFE